MNEGVGMDLWNAVSKGVDGHGNLLAMGYPRN
jgi:hypothetical protein